MSTKTQTPSVTLVVRFIDLINPTNPVPGKRIIHKKNEIIHTEYKKIHTKNEIIHTEHKKIHTKQEKTHKRVIRKVLKWLLKPHTTCSFYSMCVFSLNIDYFAAVRVPPEDGLIENHYASTIIKDMKPSGGRR